MMLCAALGTARRWTGQSSDLTIGKGCAALLLCPWVSVVTATGTLCVNAALC
jgi:hypothetical protein